MEGWQPIFSFSFVAEGVGPVEPEIDQLTDNDANDVNIAASGDRAVWQGQDSGPDWEVFLFDGSEVIMLSDNDSNDVNPQVSLSHVAWENWDGNDWEIVGYNGVSVIPLTDNDHDDLLGQLSGGQVFWQGWDGNDWEIFRAFIPGEPIEMDLKMTPQTLNLKSRGKFVTAHLQLGDEIDIDQVDSENLLLEGSISPSKISENAQAKKLTIKYDRSALQDILAAGDAVEVSVSGLLPDGTPIIATDTIRVIDRGK